MGVHAGLKRELSQPQALCPRQPLGIYPEGHMASAESRASGQLRMAQTWCPSGPRALCGTPGLGP